jgi:hypothetical protein
VSSPETGCQFKQNYGAFAAARAMKFIPKNLNFYGDTVL